MRTSKWILISGLLPLVCLSTLPAQDASESTADVAKGAEVPEVPEVNSESPETAQPLSAEERSRILKENLQSTIDEGERLLKTLPRERLRILRSRLANLQRQVKKKERERKQLNDSLANLRADYFRRLAALRGNSRQSSVEAETEELKSDYDLHAEFFEDELTALNRDISEIQDTIRKLQAKAESEEGLQPQPKRVEREAVPSDRVDGIPDALNPFKFKSYLGRVRGLKAAPRADVLGLRAEVAYQQGEVVRAAATLDEILRKKNLGHALHGMTAYNRAYMEYLHGNYPHAYRIFREHFAGDLTSENAHVLAVLAYMNGFMEQTRSYLQKTDVAHRRKMEFVLGPIARASVR